MLGTGAHCNRHIGISRRESKVDRKWIRGLGDIAGFHQGVQISICTLLSTHMCTPSLVRCRRNQVLQILRARVSGPSGPSQSPEGPFGSPEGYRQVP